MEIIAGIVTIILGYLPCLDIHTLISNHSVSNLK
jgi:hypothetical protein